MAKYVYLLSNYNEQGAEDVVATLDRSMIAGMLRTRLEKYPDQGDIPAAMLLLDELLSKTDEELSKPSEKRATGSFPHDLLGGWGGEQLHVVRLWEAT